MKTHVFTSGQDDEDLRSIGPKSAEQELAELISNYMQIITKQAETIEQLKAASTCSTCPYISFLCQQGKGRRQKKLDDMKIQTLHENGISNRAIAKIVGVTEKTIRNRLKRLR